MSSKLRLVEKTETAKADLKAMSQSLPDDFLSIGAFLKTSMDEGKFNSEDAIVEKFIGMIPDTDEASIDAFLLSVYDIVDYLRYVAWPIVQPTLSDNVRPVESIELYKKRKEIDALKKQAEELSKMSDEEEKLASRVREEFISLCGEENIFNDENLILKSPGREYESNHYKAYMEIKQHLADFFMKVFKAVIKTKGITSGVAYTYAESISSGNIPSWRTPSFELLVNGNLQNVSHDDIADQLKKAQLIVLEKEAQKESPTDIKALFRLLIWKHEHAEDIGDIAMAILKKVPETTYDQISTVFIDTWWGDKLENDFENSDLEYWDEEVSDYRNFTEEFFRVVYQSGLYDESIANTGGWFFADQRSYHDTAELPHFLYPEFIYAFYYCDGIADSGNPNMLFNIGKGFLSKDKPKEALHCFKASFFGNLFWKGGYAYLKPEQIDIEKVIEATRRAGDYERMISFLEVFPDLINHGFQIDFSFLSRLEEIRIRLEDESHAHPIGARENYPAILQTLRGRGASSDIMLSSKQLDCLLEKINQQDRVIQRLTKYGDRIEFNQRQTESMLNVLLEGQAQIIEFTSNTKKHIAKLEEKIEAMHSQNISNAPADVVEKYSQFYKDKGCLGDKLWVTLNKQTKEYLCIAQNLFEGTELSNTFPFGSIGIEYAKAIENEFCRKIIDEYYTSYDEIISGGEVLINKPKKEKDYPTIGTIAMIIKVFKQKRTNCDFNNFLRRKQISGKENKQLEDYEDKMFKIAGYRNDAAHARKNGFDRDMINSFRNLLFREGFLKEFFGDIQ